jgi:hypothetical protein
MKPESDLDERGKAKRRSATSTAVSSTTMMTNNRLLTVEIHN